MHLAASIRKLVFGISVQQATFARRGFQATRPEIQRRLEKIGETFIGGYLAALDCPSPAQLPARLNQVSEELRGFAFEGAAMALTLLDQLLPGKAWRFQGFLESSAGTHIYMLHVGAGWALARLPGLRRGVERWATSYDPLLGWLAVDGYGFHEGYFHGLRSIRRGERPRRLSPYGQRVFDQGLGRSLWFFAGANVNYIAELLSKLSRERHADLFSGLGLASAYAGGVDKTQIEKLKIAGRDFSSQLAQGAAFAAGARTRAGNPAEHTEMACQVLCGMSAADAAAITDASRPAMVHIPAMHIAGQPAYETWRLQIQQQFAKEEICHA